MSEIIIEKVKLIKSETLDISVKRKMDKDGTYVSSPGESYDRKVHQNLLNKLDELRIHLAVITGYVSVKQVKDITNPKPELFEDFKISGYSIGGKEGAEGVTITGHLLTPLGGAVILNSPFKRFEVEEEKQYPFMDNLKSILNELEEEVKAYMDGSKVGVDPQGSLFEEEATAEEEVE